MTLAQYDIGLLNGVDRAVKGAVNVACPFYRRYPYRGGLWISEVDMRVAIDPARRFLYNRLPKNANSTVTSVLRNAVGGSASQKAAKHAFTRPSRLSRAQVDALDSYFKFVIVRDPYTRTLSAYLDKIVNRRRQAKRPLRLVGKRYGTDTPSFEQFCEYLAWTGLYDDNHWAPQVDGLVLPFAQFDHVGRFEQLGTELNFVSERLFGVAYDDPRQYGPASTRAAELVDRHYTPKARSIVAKLYRKDFETFGYDTESRT
ncbi:MAG: hypothetical protein CMH12_22555 [Maritimibacter sp.]|nr:hypothetical protein [Maritimibacter sp.]